MYNQKNIEDFARRRGRNDVSDAEGLVGAYLWDEYSEIHDRVGGDIRDAYGERAHNILVALGNLTVSQAQKVVDFIEELTADKPEEEEYDMFDNGVNP